MNSIYRLTDGTTTVNFLTGVFRLNSWPSKIAQAKGGGTWQDSPLVEGRRLVAHVYGNVIEEYDFHVVAGIEDLMIQEVQDFRRLLEKTTSFWTADWQDEPAWIEVRGQNETNIRYAVIYDGSTPGDADPFGVDFTQDSPPGTVIMQNWLLLLERGQWQGDPPDGTSRCVQLSNGATFGHTVAGGLTEHPDIGANDCHVNHTLQSIDVVGNVLRMGVLANASYSVGINFQNVAIPAGSIIKWADVGLVPPAALAGNTCRIVIQGESNIAPASFSTYADFISRTRTDNVKTRGNFPSNVGGTQYYFPVENIIQEIVNLPGWASGNDITIFLEDNGSDNNAVREWHSVEGNPALQADLNYSYYTTPYDVGRTATCDNEVFLANKHVEAQITHLYHESGGAWVGNLVDTVPSALLPVAPAAGDGIYLGCRTDEDAKSGPFTSIIFDLSQGAGTAVGQWEYYNGAGWTALTEPLGTINDETELMTATGVNGVFWTKKNATNWAEEDLNVIMGGAAPAIEAYWVRFIITAAGGAPTAPTQQTRRIYATLWPEAELQSTEVTGDIQALSRLKIFNRSARGRLLSSGADQNILSPDLMANRAFLATRSTSRGDAFRLWINLVRGTGGLLAGAGISWHNPSGVSINVLNLDTDEAYDTLSPLRRSLIFNPTGVESLAERFEILMNGEIAQAYYGSYKCFIRLRQVGGLSGDFTLRVKIRTATAGTIYQSEIFTIDPKPTAGADEYMWLLSDLGRIDLVPPQLLALGDELDNLSIVFEMGNSNAAPGDLYLFDMGFLPIDEWACDCEDYSELNAGSLMSDLTTLRFLDIDGIGNARRKKRLLIRKSNTAESIAATWVYRSNGISTFQSNAGQRIYAILARSFVSGGNAFWDGNPDISSSIQAFTVPRYRSARGAR